MKNLVQAAALVFALSPLTAFADAAQDDARITQLVKAHLAEVTLPSGHVGNELQASTLRCVAIPGSMLGSCVVRGLETVCGGATVPHFYQIGVVQDPDAEGVRFEAHLIMADAW